MFNCVNAMQAFIQKGICTPHGWCRQRRHHHTHSSPVCVTLRKFKIERLFYTEYFLFSFFFTFSTQRLFGALVVDVAVHSHHPDFPINTLKQGNKYKTKRTGKNRKSTTKTHTAWTVEREKREEKYITIKTASRGKYLIVISVGLAENFLM